MKRFSSWLKKSATDAEKLSNVAAVAMCVVAGAAILYGTKFAATKAPAPPQSDNNASAIAVSTAIFVREPEPIVAEQETTPDEPAPDEPEPPPLPPEPDATTEPEMVAEPEMVVAEPPPEPIVAEQEDEPEPTTDPPEKPEELPATTNPPEPPLLPQPPPPTQDDNNEEEAAAARQTLYGVLTTAIRKKKFYSRAARRLELTGTVFVKIDIGNNGAIANYELCGNATPPRQLSANALEIVRRVAEDFRVSDAPENSLPAEFVVPIEFELN